MNSTIPRQIGDYVELLDARVPFTLCNIGGDGEFRTITGWDGVNSDDRESTPEKGAALAQVILEPRMKYHGYNPGRLPSDHLAASEKWLWLHGVNVPNRDNGFKDPDYGGADINVQWVHKEIISSANVRGDLKEFILALRERGTFVIGTDWLTDDLLKMVGAVEEYRIPVEEGWEALDEIEARVRKVFASMTPETVVSWGLGYLTKVLMWRLAPDFPRVTQIDVGAVWDPYCGILNRHGYRKPEWAEAMIANRP